MILFLRAGSILIRILREGLSVKRFEADEDATPIVATAFEDAGLTVFRDANQLANVGDVSVAIVLKTP